MSRSPFAARRLCTLVFTVLLAGMPALAADSVKVGFVNVARVLDKAPQAEEARERIEREFGPKDRVLLSQQRELRALEDQLLRDGATMSESERLQLEQEIRTQRREIRRAQEEFREELNLRRSQELSKLQRKVLEVIQELARSENYDLVVSDGVVFAGERIDITDKVIGRLREEYE